MEFHPLPVIQWILPVYCNFMKAQKDGFRASRLVSTWGCGEHCAPRESKPEPAPPLTLGLLIGC